MATNPIHHKPLRIYKTSWWAMHNGDVAVVAYVIVALLTGYCAYCGALMFTTQDDVAWWAARWKWVRHWQHERTPFVAHMGMVHYRNLLIATFTHLFNHRLKKKGRCL
jgi:hypothetical protein